jgi:hypothetical protein
MTDPTPEERARRAFPGEQCCLQNKECLPRDIANADHDKLCEYHSCFVEIHLAVAAENERCAKVAEGGRFLHDDAPDARFGKACAAAIRALQSQA